MPHYRVHALPQITAEKVRATLRSPGYGHPAHVELAAGYGPCRLCLRHFAAGEERRILFTYDPFGESGAPPLPGPVFIHEQPCERYPEDGGFPQHLLEHPLTFVAYGRGRRTIAEVQVEDRAAAEAALTALLADPLVDYVHVRDTRAGCFDLRVEPDHSARRAS